MKAFCGSCYIEHKNIYLVGKENLRYYSEYATMEIHFKNNNQKDFYQTEKALITKHGKRMATKIIQRIDELQAAENPKQLPQNARFHEHSGKREGLFSIDLIHPFRLIVRPTCEYIHWYEITSIEIYEIMDPH